jgi:hypothetical protein
MTRTTGPFRLRALAAENASLFWDRFGGVTLGRSQLAIPETVDAINRGIIYGMARLRISTTVDGSVLERARELLGFVTQKCSMPQCEH